MAIMLIDEDQGRRDRLHTALAAEDQTVLQFSTREDALEVLRLDPKGFPVIISGPVAGGIGNTKFANWAYRICAEQDPRVIDYSERAPLSGVVAHAIEALHAK